MASSFGLKYRAGVAQGDAARDEGLTTPETVERFDDISYGSDGIWNLLDIYRPRSGTGNLPVIVNIHGGGWVSGMKESAQYYCMSLAHYGFAVINFNYRLAPEYQHPAGLEDVNRVIRWLLAHGSDYQMDTTKVFLTGDSAGANMAALYCCICTNQAYADYYDFKVPEGFCPTAAALNCGVYDIPKNRIGLIGMFMKDLLGAGYKRRQLELISPIRYITKDFPPVYMMTALGDFLKKDALRMIKILEQKGAPYEYKLYGTKENKLTHVFHCNIKLKEAQECNEEECLFFHEFL